LSAIIEALKSSETVELVDNDTKVRRKTALPESVNDSFDPNVVKVFEDEAMGRSVYAKGFGEEVPTTQFDIEAFFAPYGPTNAIRLRRSWDKIFKGSVFVEFDSEETQKKFLALDPKPKWKGQELLIKSKKDYCDEKVKDIEAGRIKPKSNGFRGRGRGRGGGRGGRGDNRDWRDRRDEDQKKGFQRGGRGNHRGRVRDGEPPKSNIKKDVRYVTS
jgi:lupus La protein